jgi:hypothetical protein
VAYRQVDVAYVEFPPVKPYVFDFLNIRQLESELSLHYIDHAQSLSTGETLPKAKGFRHNGVQWIVNDSRYSPAADWSDEKMMKLIYSLREIPIIVVDISTLWNDSSAHSLLMQADEAYVCIEPDPVKIDWTSTVHDRSDPSFVPIDEYQTLQRLQRLQDTSHLEYKYIEMKMHTGLRVNTWHECLEKKPVTSLNYIPYKDVIRSVWESKFLYDEPRYYETFEKSFQPLLQSLLPENYVHREKKAGFLKKWIKRGHVE